MSKKSPPTHFPATRFPWAAANITSYSFLFYLFISVLFTSG